MSIAADTVHQMIRDGLTDEQGHVHAETSIAAAAALAGECALLAARHDLGIVRPGQAVYSDRVTTLLFGRTLDPSQWPADSVWGIVRDAAPALLIPPERIPAPDELDRNAAAHVYEGALTYLSVPRANHPREEPLRLAARFREGFQKMARDFRLRPNEKTAAATLAFIQAVAVCSVGDPFTPAMEVGIGLRLAFEVVIGAAKTCPLLRPNERVDPEAFGRRFILFEEQAQE
jgi:hypothetical protein